MSATISCDLAIVGGGLAGGLIALAVHVRHPGADVRLIEASPRLGGNHLWSFFASDVAPADRWLVARLIRNLPFRFTISIRAPFRALLGTARSYADPSLLLAGAGLAAPAAAAGPPPAPSFSPPSAIPCHRPGHGDVPERGC